MDENTILNEYPAEDPNAILDERAYLMLEVPAKGEKLSDAQKLILLPYAKSFLEQSDAINNSEFPFHEKME